MQIFSSLFRLLFFVLAASMILLPALAVRAEEDPADAEIETIQPFEDGYIPTTFANLSKLYWAVGLLDLNDNEAIDNYMIINECELYQTYYHNDFEWSHIRDATRKNIADSLSTFPKKYEIMTPIYLGRYDTDKKEFEIREDDQMVNTRRVDATVNDVHAVCGKTGSIKGYPRNIIAVLNRPLTLKSFPVDPILAGLYIDETRTMFEQLPLKMRVEKYERPAYLRLRINILQYKETITVRGRDERAVMFVKVDGYEVYADSDKMKLLYKKDIKDRRFRRAEHLRQLSGEEAGGAEESDAGESQ